MAKEVAVIVSPCVKGTPEGEGRIYGERLVDKTFPTVEEALKQGGLYRTLGQSVVVRPRYNEKDEKGSYFREWRSFNGEPFKECRWPLDSNHTGG